MADFIYVIYFDIYDAMYDQFKKKIFRSIV